MIETHRFLAILAGISAITSDTHNIFVMKSSHTPLDDRIIYENTLRLSSRGIQLSVDVLEISEKTFGHDSLRTLCNRTTRNGVSLLISADTDAHLRLVELFGSYMGIPSVKLYNDPVSDRRIKDNRVIVLNVAPPYKLHLEAIYQTLDFYSLDDRVAIISQDNAFYQSLTILLARRLREKHQGHNSKIITNFTITGNQYHDFSTIKILQVLKLTAVVVLMDVDSATYLMEEAYGHGLQDLGCIWVLSDIGPLVKTSPFVHFRYLLTVEFSTEVGLLSPNKTVLVLETINLFACVLQKSREDGTFREGPPVNCDSEKPWKMGRILYRGMVNSCDNRTDLPRFDEYGTRTSGIYEVRHWPTTKSSRVDNQSTNFVDRTVIARYEVKKHTFVKLSWPPRGDTTLEERIERGKPLFFSIIEQSPYIMVNSRDVPESTDGFCGFGLPCRGVNGDLLCCTGYCIDIIKLLMADIKFDAELRLVKDGKYGGLNITSGQWSGIIGEVARGESDIGFADLTINEQRSNVVDFTHPYLDSGMGVVVESYGQTYDHWSAFLKPFSPWLWLGIIVIITTTLLCMWFIERLGFYFAPDRISKQKKRTVSSLSDTFWFTWTLVFQSFDVGTRPKSLASRFVALFFAFGMLIFLTSYTANLAAHLVIEEDILPLTDEGIRDIKLQNPNTALKIATVKDSSYEQFFQVTKDPDFRRIWTHMKHNSQPTLEKGIKMLGTRELHAFVADYPTLEHFAALDEDCSLKVVGLPFFHSGLAMAVRKNSTLTDIISRTFINYAKYDIIRKLKSRWFSGHCMVNVNAKKFRRLSPKDFLGLFVATCVSCFVCAVSSMIRTHIGACIDARNGS